MDSYDFIFAGAGCAGLSLVHYLLESNLKDSKILLIDPQGSQMPNKTWCYWAEKPLDIHPVEHIHFWNNLNLVAEQSKIHKNLGKLNYYHLNSHDFYNSILKKIAKHPNVKWIQDEVVKLTSSNRFSVTVETRSHGNFTTPQVIDSRLDENEFNTSSALKQLFTGWRIKTELETFDPGSVTLMEFPVRNSEQFEFFYILPFSKTEALVEYTLYSQKTISKEKLQSSLEDYLKSNLGSTPFEITFQEYGMIPMSTQKNISAKQNRVTKIGTTAGWTKASTGYTFHTIQTNCKLICEALVRGDVDKLDLSRSKRFSFYDNILLNIAHKWPERLQGLFVNLFTTSSAELVLKFLSEETTVTEELKLLGKLRFPIFIKSLMNYEAH